MALLIIYLILYLFIYLDLTLQVLHNLYLKKKTDMLRQLPWAGFKPEHYNKNVVIQTMPSMSCHLNNFSVDIHPYISQLMYQLFRTQPCFY